jgi:hypothetical protein
MAFIPAPSSRPVHSASASRLIPPPVFQLHPLPPRSNGAIFVLALAIVAFAVLAPSAIRAQATSPHISSVTPDTGKANDSITITGENLGKDKVAAVFLSDAKLDHKAIVLDQEPTKIVIKVPNLQPGDYNISVQEGSAIYIQPVIFKVTA